MKAELHPRKNPYMSQVDDAVRDAAARQNGGEATATATATPDAGFQEARAQPQYNGVRAPLTASEYHAQFQQRGAQGVVGAVAEPVGLLATVKAVPWWAWVGIAAGGLLLAAYFTDGKKTRQPAQNKPRRRKQQQNVVPDDVEPEEVEENEEEEEDEDESGPRYGPREDDQDEPDDEDEPEEEE